jgi:hypothetical protein
MKGALRQKAGDEATACQLTGSGAGATFVLSLAKGDFAMFRAALVVVSLAFLPLSAAAATQDGKDGPPAASAPAAAGSRCTEEQRDSARQRGRGMGGMLGGIARGIGGRVGGVAGMVTSMLPVDQLLGDAIASMLDCREQQQAAHATEEATRGGVGTTSTWRSDSRPGVTGSSTVTAVEQHASDGDCMTVTDVVIVDGQETRAPKRMCRRPPNNRYVRV